MPLQNTSCINFRISLEFFFFHLRIIHSITSSFFSVSPICALFPVKKVLSFQASSPCLSSISIVNLLVRLLQKEGAASLNPLSHLTITTFAIYSASSFNTFSKNILLSLIFKIKHGLLQLKLNVEQNFAFLTISLNEDLFSDIVFSLKNFMQI